MPTAVVMPKLGNSVESCIIVAWKKNVGDSVDAGETVCEVETDKAVMEVESPEAGVFLARFFAEGDEVPVMTNIAAVGQAGEDASPLAPDGAAASPAPTPPAAEPVVPPPPASPPAGSAPAPGMQPAADPAPGAAAVSPRARKLAARKDLPVAGLFGSGPGGRIIERDVEAALVAQPKLTPVAQAMVASGAYAAPAQGTGPGGRVTKGDLISKAAEPAAGVAAEPAPGPTQTAPDEVEIIPVKGVRKVIAQRMLASLQTTAQLTLNATADARSVQRLRARFKASDPAMGLHQVTINDLILFAVSRALPQHPDLNATFQEMEIRRYRPVHLGVAVDTPRGLLVPVIRSADGLTLRALAQEARRLAGGAQEGRLNPDELVGGTFTVTNLGAFGVESFTPVLNAPQVAILGVGNINLKPVPGDGGEVTFVPHLGLSLTINHQVVDGAPAARFLQTLAQYLADLDLLLAG